MRTNRLYKAFGFRGFLNRYFTFSSKRTKFACRRDKRRNRLETLGNKRHFCFVSQDEQTAAFPASSSYVFRGRNHLPHSPTQQDSHRAFRDPLTKSTSSSSSSSSQGILHAGGTRNCQLTEGAPFASVQLPPANCGEVSSDLSRLRHPGHTTRCTRPQTELHSKRTLLLMHYGCDPTACLLGRPLIPMGFTPA